MKEPPIKQKTEAVPPHPSFLAMNYVHPPTPSFLAVNYVHPPTLSFLAVKDVHPPTPSVLGCGLGPPWPRVVPFLT